MESTYPRRLGQPLERLQVCSSCMQQHGKCITTLCVCWTLIWWNTKYSANNFALKSKRKTLNATDVFSALEDMEFEHFAPELKEFLEGEF